MMLYLIITIESKILSFSKKEYAEIYNRINDNEYQIGTLYTESDLTGVEIIDDYKMLNYLEDIIISNNDPFHEDFMNYTQSIIEYVTEMRECIKDSITY